MMNNGITQKRIRVKVKTNQKVEKVEMVEELLTVWVKAPAIEGKANKRICAVLAKHFNIPKTSAKIIKGHKSNLKIIEINN